MDNIKTTILQRLLPMGVQDSEISFRGSNGVSTHFTYHGWRPLPADAFDSINDLVSEELYEDYDGDGEGGRPIIRRMWYYEFVNK
jgi:hypothetical protein